MEWSSDVLFVSDVIFDEMPNRKSDVMFAVTSLPIFDNIFDEMFNPKSDVMFTVTSLPIFDVIFDDICSIIFSVVFDIISSIVFISDILFDEILLEDTEEFEFRYRTNILG